jgi:hypothetical protein
MENFSPIAFYSFHVGAILLSHGAVFLSRDEIITILII